ncbi:MAG TPA: MBL fold metallo-hydrolase, partial [Thermoplasmatales archaeon]|nr:MBL fold metallo-hydrolase [Thermoplasmatales archaeon]
NMEFDTPVRHVHGVETYGLNLYGDGVTISLISDTRYFEGIEKHYRGDILILNVVRMEPREDILHLSLRDAEKIIETNRPKLAILTHFGMGMLRAKPWKLAEEMSKRLNLNVIAANDGMMVDVEKYKTK